MSVIIDGRTSSVETISYAPGYTVSGNLVPGPSYVVTAVAEAVGLGAADFVVPLAIPAPTDARIIVNAIAMYLGIDSTVADGNLYCRVYVDVQDDDHRLFDVSFWPGALEEFDATLSPVWIPDAFNLIADGLIHDYYFYFWKDGAGVGAEFVGLELNMGVGVDATIGPLEVLTINNVRGSVTVSGLITNREAAWLGGLVTWILVSPASGTPLTNDVAYADTWWELVEGLPTSTWMLLSQKNVRTVNAAGSLGVILLSYDFLVILDSIYFVVRRESE